MKKYLLGLLLTGFFAIPAIALDGVAVIDLRTAVLATQAAKDAFSGNLLGSSMPSINVTPGNLKNKISIMDLILLSKLETSKSEIRRLVKGNAIKINDSTVSDEKLIISLDLFKENYLKLSVGKKRHIKVQLN